MQQMLTLVMCAGVMAAFSLTRIRPAVDILPGQQNYLVPFVLERDDGESETSLFTLAIECTKASQQVISITSEGQNACEAFTRTLQASELNALLNALVASAAGRDEAAMSVSYTLRPASTNTTVIGQTVTQSLAVPATIPLDLLASSLQLPSGLNTLGPADARQLVLRVRASYLFNSQTSNFELIKENWPADLTFVFVDSDLFLVPGESGKDLLEVPEIDFYIRDKTTGLLSQRVVLPVNPGYSKTPVTGSDHRMLLLTCFSVASLIVVVLLALLVSARRAKQQSRAASRPTCSIKEIITTNAAVKDRLEQKALPVPESVLSNSVVSWNKRLLEQHNSRHAEDKSLAVMFPAGCFGADLAKNDRKVGHSGFSDCNAREITAEDFDNLSEISADEPVFLERIKSVELQKQASFLDDFKL